VTLKQACQTHNTVRAAKGVLKPKMVFAGRSEKIIDLFCFGGFFSQISL